MTVEDKTKYTNALIHESSPYLLQHAHNPVNWYPWGIEAFEKAQLENKLVLISIGYAACHWCHVMAHESFESESIARVMNEKFICIKVDREERPDVDQIYMTAVQLITGSGGWPLNCFTLPDGRPVYGGTYFRPDQWVQVLEGLVQTFKTDKNHVLEVAAEIEKGIQQHELIQVKTEESGFSNKIIHNALSNWKPYFDIEWGGNKRAPKFPMPSGLQFLLTYQAQFQDEEVASHLQLTLDKMAYGGIYDQVGGGFARYSVDAYWKVPHFEKMLYDNGQLVSLYAGAYKYFQKPLYKRIVKETLDFVQQELLSSECAFYASFDADSEGQEGKFYVWSHQEIEQVLGEDASWFQAYFNVTRTGNWEGENILWITQPEFLQHSLGWDAAMQEQKINQAKQKLYEQRKHRIWPGLDDKILTSWNALMALGFIDASEALKHEDYLLVALKNAGFIKQQVLRDDYSLLRNYKNGIASIDAFLEDYALVIRLFIRLYQSTFDIQWLEDAKAMLSYVLDNFQDETLGMFYYTNKKYHQLVARKMELTDNVIPSSNALMAHNLFQMGTLFSNNDWLNMSRQMVANTQQHIEQNAAYFSCWAQLYQQFAEPVYEVIFVGEEAIAMQKAFMQRYFPNVVVAGAYSDESCKLPLLQNRWIEGKTLIYVCVNNQCNLPVESVEEAWKMIQ